MKNAQNLNISDNRPNPSSSGSSRVKANEDSESISVYEFEKAKKFGESHSPILSNEKRDMIENKLSLERIAESNAADRLDHNRQFVKYNKNPFSDIGSRSYYSISRQNEDFQEEREEDIIDAVNKLTNKQVLPLNPQLKVRREEYTKISSVLGRVEKFASMPITHQQFAQATSKKEMSFQQIVSFPEQPFNAYRQPNLFKAARTQKELFSIDELLNRNYFYFSGLSNYNRKITIPFDSHLSSVSRKTILRKDKIIESKFDVINPNETNVYVDKIDIDNLLGIASGRVSSHLAFNSFHQISPTQTYQQSTTDAQPDEIIYPYNTSNASTNFSDVDFERDQVKNYLQLEVSKQEKKTFKKYDELAKMIKMKLQTRNGVIQNKINDRPLHQKLQGEINDNIGYLIDLNQKREEDIDRLISRNKQYKDRSISYRNKLVVSSLIEKKNYDRMLKDLTSQPH